MLKRLSLFLIRFYRLYLSSLKRSPCCRFRPTCSAYAYHAFNEWGFVCGLLLTVWRILRCNPVGGFGYDPIPRKKRKTVPRSFDFVRRDEEPRLPFWCWYTPS